jgi:hypothetical protein
MGLCVIWNRIYRDIVFAKGKWMVMEAQVIKNGGVYSQEEDDQWGQSLAR